MKREEARARLELLLADAALDEAREREERAWADRANPNFPTATEATRLRRLAEFTQSRARAAVRATNPEEEYMSTTVTLASLRAERAAMVQARKEARGSRKGIATKRIKELDAQIAEFDLAAPAGEPDEVVAEAGTLTPTIAAILLAGEKVSKAALIEAIIADAKALGSTNPDLSGMGDPVVARGLLASYSPKWVGRWLGAGPEKAALKALTPVAS
jgi:hypothetical protein